MDTTHALLRLHHAAGNAAWLRDALLTANGDAAAVLAAAPAAIRAAASTRDAVDHASHTLAWRDAAPQRHVLGWADAGYPSLLREAPSPPLLLFVDGNAEKLWWPQIAIVGSRAPTPAGRERAARWARAFVDAGYVVTSGLASGIDAAAHSAALGAPGTIAVTGTGPDRCFPAAHRPLHAAIADQGAVVTEHPPGTEARAEHFPSRNRIIAGLSLATVVIEAAQRSGALITARLAVESGREVFALPGAPENLKARGCHRLIRDGATLVDDPAQVLDAITASAGTIGDALRQRLGAVPRDATHGAMPATRDLFDGGSDGDDIGNAAQARVRAALGADGMRFDELLARSGLTPTALAPILLAMELDGRLTQQHGVYLPSIEAPPTRAGLQRRR